MTAAVVRADARDLPLPDASVDLICTSPPYWALRDYRDGAASMAGQIGSEATPQEWLAALVECTAEWVRVLKPTGSIFVNLGDKFSTGNSGESGMAKLGEKWAGGGHSDAKAKRRSAAVPGVPPKSLLGLPYRYAIACTDELGLILRRDIIWAKPNGLPESVTDRCRSSHEYLFHLVRQPRYYAAVDEIREPQAEAWRSTGRLENRGTESLHYQGVGFAGLTPRQYNPLGKLPGSVWRIEDDRIWDIPSQPLQVPAHLGVDHFAAFPMELPRRCILGWSPPGVCTRCGQGRRPVADVTHVADRWGRKQRIIDYSLDAAHGHDGRGGERWKQTVAITGYACGCTPYTDHPGTGGTSNRRGYDATQNGSNPQGVYSNQAGEYQRVGPWREFHFDRWTPPPTTPALVLDPFGGTGTTALVASVLGRHAITADLSADYCRLAAWRTTDPGERARAMQVPKPPPVVDGQEALFSLP